MTKSMEQLFVWSGGGLFVASLGFGAYTYVVRWSGAAAPTDSWGPWVSNSLLLSLFAAHHSVFAREPVKRWLAGHVPDRLIRSVYVWIAALLFLATCALWRPIGGELHDTHGWGAALLGLVQLVGLGFIARSVATIDALDLAGIRQIQPSARPQAEDPGQGGEAKGVSADRTVGLQITGPYRFVRHPLYFGWLLVTFGAPHLTGDRFAFAALTTLYLVVAIPWEERSLIASFGPDYERYMKAVRWRLLPYVY